MQRISVIIPTYNRAALLTECIAAILRQSLTIHEIIVVDDGSTDRTRAVVSALSSRIRYFYQQNCGKAAALNNGLKYCTGEYVWICDDDDVALPDAASMLINALERDKTAAFAFGRYRRFSVDPLTDERLIFEPVYWPDLESVSVLVAMLEDCFIFQNACLVRRSIFDIVGPFREDLIRSQDYEMTLRLVQHFQSTYVPEVVFLQRAHVGLRGSRLDRFGSGDQMKKWLHYDMMFFRDLYNAIPLIDFAPKRSAGSNLDAARRSALLQRACIFWRRKLFDLSLTDMREAIRITQAGKLTVTEQHICGRFFHQKFGCDELATRPILANDLCAMADDSELGRSIMKALTAPLLWYIRDALMRRRWCEGLGFAGLLLRIHGFGGTLSLVGRNLGKRLLPISN